MNGKQLLDLLFSYSPEQLKGDVVVTTSEGAYNKIKSVEPSTMLDIDKGEVPAIILTKEL